MTSKTNSRNISWHDQSTTPIIVLCKTMVSQVFTLLSVLHLLWYYLTTNSLWLYIWGCLHHLVYPDVDALECYYFLQSHAWIKIWNIVLVCIRYAYFHILACVLHKSRSRLKKKCRSSLEKSTDREMQRRTEAELSFNERYWLTTNLLSFHIQIESIINAFWTMNVNFLIYWF